VLFRKEIPGNIGETIIYQIYYIKNVFLSIYLFQLRLAAEKDGSAGFKTP